MPPSRSIFISYAHENAIAVLPFEHRSADANDAYFTDGVHDDLLTHISRIRALRTISRTSVMGYRGTTKNMLTIGELAPIPQATEPNSNLRRTAA